MSEWISVEDRLPVLTSDASDVVLVLVDDGSVELAQFWKDGEWSDKDHCYGIEGITHWVPLPEPPNE